jgi:hypothetical protein
MMKPATFATKALVLLLGLLFFVACDPGPKRLSELERTSEAVGQATTTVEAGKTAQVEEATAVSEALATAAEEARQMIQTAIPATLTAIATPTPQPAATDILSQEEVLLVSIHGQYVIADDEPPWALRQDTEVSDCGWFNLQYLANGKITLVTCMGRYVTAPDPDPETDPSRADWMLGQESELGKCGQFDRYDMGGERIALKTCSGNLVTAGDGGWGPGLVWSIVAETEYLDDWEIFTVKLELDPPREPLSLPLIANFESCHDEGRMRPVFPRDSRLEVSYVEEAGSGCNARLEYEVVDWSAFLFELQGSDLSPYNELVFDVRADTQDIPKEVKIELKRAAGGEVSILYVSDITTDWQTKRVELSDFVGSLRSLTEMEELLFTVGPNGSPSTGVFYLDNIRLAE